MLALDVEYAHFRDGSDAPAEVCLVEQGGGVVFHSFCNPGVGLGFADNQVGGCFLSFRLGLQLNIPLVGVKRLRVSKVRYLLLSCLA